MASWSDISGNGLCRCRRWSRQEWSASFLKSSEERLSLARVNETTCSIGLWLFYRVSVVYPILKITNTCSLNRRKRVFHSITNTTLTLSVKNWNVTLYLFLLFRLPAITGRVNCRHSSFVLMARNQNSPANHHMKMRFLGDMGSGDNVFSPFWLLLEKKVDPWTPVCLFRILISCSLLVPLTSVHLLHFSLLH